MGQPDARQVHEAFLAGHAAVREPHEADLRAAPWLHLGLDLWGVALDLKLRVLPLGEDAARAEQLE